MGKRDKNPSGQYGLEQAAQELNIGIATLFRWMRIGTIREEGIIRVYRRTFIKKSEVERLKREATG